MSKFGFLVLCMATAFSTVSISAQARANGPEAGDEDPFPLVCVNLSGSWKSDVGDRYVIQQRKCAFLEMQVSYNGTVGSMITIIPDNKTRADGGSQVRHRWNAPENATALESHRVYFGDLSTRITEVTTFERISADLLLQTLYVTIEDVSQPKQPRHEYHQTIFRRDTGLNGSGVGLPNGFH